MGGNTNENKRHSVLRECDNCIHAKMKGYKRMYCDKFERETGRHDYCHCFAFKGEQLRFDNFL